MYLGTAYGTNKLVASGLRWPTEPGMKIHFADLQPGHAKVTVTVVNNNSRHMELSVPVREIENLG